LTESRNPGRLPVGHVVFRVLLASLVVILIVAAVIAAVLHRGGELALGRIVWDAVKHGALPW
jgi:hypothetical protein